MFHAHEFHIPLIHKNLPWFEPQLVVPLLGNLLPVETRPVPAVVVVSPTRHSDVTIEFGRVEGKSVLEEGEHSAVA